MAEYIEREAAIKELNDSIKDKCDTYGLGVMAGISFAVQKVINAPAADVVEVRHGRWDDSGRYKFPNGETAVCCTECGCALRKKEYENNNWFYCPVCGAIMDKEENHV